VRLARQVGAAGGTFPAVYNAANEVCVDAFHDRRIRFPAIVETVARVVERHNGSNSDASSVEEVLTADRWARQCAAELIGVGSGADHATEAR
jgi:1-deoxy-D-xylulose-5-phosphate reductoisomerase